MAASTAALNAAATELREAEISRRAIAPISERYPEFELADAYAVQKINRELRLASGERIVGHKIGLTSEAMQRMLGVTTPDVGSITDRMVVANGGEFALEQLIAGHIEAEFAFRIGTSLGGAEVDAVALRAAISHVALAAEIIDSRIRDWQIGLVDTVADNASSARIVTGEWLPASAALLDGLPAQVIRLGEDGAVIGEGPGSAVLGDPLEALLWLAGTLAQQGIALREGDIVLAGSVHRMQPMRAGSRYEVASEGFGTVSLRVV